MPRDYGQFCGLARAMEIVGGRWALLVVRDLLAGPKRFTDLQEGLPGIPTNVLSARLRELEEAGIVRREILPRPATGFAYELTESGRDLEEPVIRLGVWGARFMYPPREDEFVSLHALSLGLKGAFRPERAGAADRLYELRVEGQSLLVAVSAGEISFPTEPPRRPHVAVEADHTTMYELLAGLTGVEEAVASHRATVEGSKTEARRLFEMFRLDPAPDGPALSGSETPVRR